MTSPESGEIMVQVMAREINIISRTLSSTSGENSRAASPSPMAPDPAKLISYQMTPKPPPEPLPFPLNLLTICFSGNMKYVVFPLLLSFTLGLFLAFSKAVSTTHGTKGYQAQYHDLNEDDPNYVPPEHVMFGHMMHDRSLGGLNRRGGQPCDCSLCELDTGPPGLFKGESSQYKALVAYSVSNFYGNKEIASHIEAFVPRKRQIWSLDTNLYLPANEVCTKTRPLAIILCSTKHQHVSQRKAIRLTWGRVTRGETWPNKQLAGAVKLVFISGVSKLDDDNNILAQESEKFGDVVVSDFEESSDEDIDGSKKTLMGFKWVTKYCPRAQYVIKLNDDAFIDVPRILSILSAQSSTNVIWGQVVYEEKVPRGRKEVRGTKYPERLTEAEYKPAWFPPYVKGDIYAMPSILAKKIFQVSEHFPYVPREDVFITGIVAKAFQAQHVGIPDSLIEKKHEESQDMCSFVNEKLIAAQNVDATMAYLWWKGIETPDSCKNKT